MTRETLREHFQTPRLPTAAAVVGESLDLAQREGRSLETFLLHLLEQELEGRGELRTLRLLKASHACPVLGVPASGQDAGELQPGAPAPAGATATGRPGGGAQRFIARGDNLLVFGAPGTGKTHLVAGLGQAWVERNHSVLYTPTYQLVGGLLRAKRDYELEQELRRLDRFEVVILDDLGYVQQSREEMEVLFTFLAERYERRSVAITSNLVFSQWDQILKDPLTTAAGIDRVVHHSLIIEFGKEVRSVRAEEAARRNDIVLPVSPEEPPRASEQ